MMKNVIVWCLGVCLLGFTSCNIINPDEPVPQYIHIDSFQVVSYDDSYHGSVSKNITEAWVYVDNFNVGNFQLPADIPVVVEGEDSVRLSIAAGIKVDGRSLSRRRYPFYTRYNQLLAKSATKQTIIPTIEYRGGQDFKLIEDFENGNSFIPYTSPDTGLARTSLPQYVNDGANGGLIFLDGTNRTARVTTVQDFSFVSNKESFLELDYKCDIPFTVEVQLVTLGSTVIITDLLSINIREDWNKIYINLTEIGQNYAGSKVNFILKAGLTPGQTSGFVAVDNFKIISQ